MCAANRTIKTVRSTSNRFRVSSVGAPVATCHDMGTHRGPADRSAQNGRVREAVTSARRIVVKIGSSSLTTATGGLDDARVDALVEVWRGRDLG